MDIQFIYNILIPAVLVMCGWFLRELWTAVQELKEDLSDLKDTLPNTYLRRDDFIDRWNEVMQLLHRIEDKLDRKADR